MPNDPELRRVLEKVAAMPSALDGPALKPYPPAISHYIAHTGDHPYMVAFAIFAAIAEYRSWPPAEDPAGAPYERLRLYWPTPTAWVRKLLSAETDAEAVSGVTWAHSYLTWMHRYSAMDPTAALWMPPVTPPAANHHPESRPTVAAIDQMIDATAATLAAGPTPEPEPPDPAPE